MVCVPCGFEVIPRQDPQIPVVAPAACPECGESQFHAEVSLRETITMRDSMAYKARGPRGGKQRAVLESGKVGSSLFRRTGRWHSLFRRIDHVNGTYDEIITDEQTGEVVREVHEPLSEHTGRGSARRNPRAEE